MTSKKSIFLPHFSLSLFILSFKDFSQPLCFIVESTFNLFGLCLKFGFSGLILLAKMSSNILQEKNLIVFWLLDSKLTKLLTNC